MMDKHIPIADGERVVHVRGNNQAGYQVWLNREGQDFDGVLLATGTDKREAVETALEVLEESIEVLRGED